MGAGISAIQAALYAEKKGKKVYLISRHPLRIHQFDSDPGWLGPKFMSKFLREKNYLKKKKMDS